MKKSSLFTILGFAIAIAVVVSGFFLLGIEQIAIHFLALAFLVLSLLVSMGALVTITQRKAARDTVFYGAGTSAAVWVYQVAVIISVALVGVFNGRIGIFIFTEIVINAVFSIVTLAINLSARRIHASNAKTYERQENGEYNTPKRGGF